VVVADIDELAIAGLVKVHDPIQKVNVAFTDLHGVTVELIEPAGEGSPVAASLKKGIKLVHLCVEVTDMSKAIEFAEKGDFRQLSQPVPAVAFEGRAIVWMFHPTFGLFELLAQ
jgi:methylmalonyl-CoA/ethylmalonyl-CoA epimerase